MDTDQILKQVDWLDEERRKDQNRIGSLEEMVAGIDENITPLTHQLKELNGEISRFSALITRMDNVDESLLHKKREEDTEKVLRTELRSLENALAEVNKDLDQLSELRRNMEARVEEETRLGRSIEDIRNKMETVRRSEEEYTRTIRLIDDGRRQDSKRLTDLQGEVSAIRKRVDDERGKLDLNSSTLKKVETHVNELAAVETERREEVSKFLENQSMRDVERERVWKEWQSRFELIETQSTDVENTLQSLDATQRTVKRSQQAVDDLTQKVERRISEITEMQRLSEERFRQEWVTFKADDQKRWTNYTLTMEEQRNETIRQHENLIEKITNLEDEVQEILDLIGQMNEHTEKRLQSLLALTHEWVSSYERTVARTR